MNQFGISDELFDQISLYLAKGENPEDSLRRAELLGMGGRGVTVSPGAIVRVKDPSKVGKNVHIGLYSYVNSDVTIGNNVLIGPHCSLPAGNHKYDPETGWFSARTEKDGDDSIVIGEGCWLASNVVVSAGVKMGKCNLICAGAVVTKSTPDYAIMAGIPASQIGRIDPETGKYIWFSHETKPQDGLA